MAMDKPVLVDTSALIALFNANERYHEDCVMVADNLPVGKTYTCWPVITEAAYLLRRYPTQRDELLSAVVQEEFILLPLTMYDLPGIRQVLSDYMDQEIDLADAALVHLANREDIYAMFTLDRRHFHVFRRDNRKKFQILPHP